MLPVFPNTVFYDHHRGRDVYQLALDAQGTMIDSWTWADVAWVERVVYQIDLSRVPWFKPIRLAVGGQSPPKFRPRLIIELPTLFDRGTEATVERVLTLSMTIPLAVIRSDKDVVEIALRFLADSMAHELREAATYQGARVFDPHPANGIGRFEPNPKWAWDETKAPAMRPGLASLLDGAGI